MVPFILVMLCYLISKGSAGYLADRKINPPGATPFLNIKVENPDLEAEICDNAAIHCSKQSTYSIDGSCNSVNHAYAGAAGMPYARLFGPAYDLSLRETKATLNSLPRHANATMPSPGFLSQKLFEPQLLQSREESRFYLLNSFYAFAINDISLPPKKEKVDCCDGDYDDLKDCAPFHVDQSFVDPVCIDDDPPEVSFESKAGMECALAVDGQFEELATTPSGTYSFDLLDRYQSLGVVCLPESVGLDSIGNLVNSEVVPVTSSGSTIVSDADLGFKITVNSNSEIITDMDHASLWRCTDQPSSVAWSEPNFDDSSWDAADPRGEYIWTSDVRTYTVVKTAVTWTEAKTRCANMGARLAQPVNEEENEHIKSELLDINNQVWFGLEKVGTVWQYTDGSVPGFTDWGPGMPSGNGNCGSYLKRNLWNDAPCRRKFYYICENLVPKTVFCRLTRRPDYNYITVGGTGPLEMWLNGISRPLKNGQDVELSDRVHLTGKIEMAALKLTLTDKANYLANGLLYETNVIPDYVRCLPSTDPNGPKDWFTCDFDDSAWKAPIVSSSTSSLAGINNNNWITGKASQASFLYCRIKITNSDRCIGYKRTQPYCYEHGTPRRAWRQQVNYQTSFFDLSQIYGTTKTRSELLRTKEHGLMKTSRTAGTCKGELPLRTADKDGNLDDTQPTLISGDDQHLLFPVVQALYTTFTRAHNHIAKALKLVNSYLSDEELYQEARRINIAQYQAIIYELLDIFSPNVEYPTMYDTRIKAGTLLSADLAQRFLSAITTPEDISWMEADDSSGSMPLSGYLSEILTAESDDPIFSSDCATDDLLRYGTMNLEPSLDSLVASPLLCSNAKFVDMIAQLFMTGRDHGLQSYQKYSDFCGVSPLEVPSVLGRFYRQEKDMELLAGMKAELDENNFSKTGRCLSGLQFSRIINGDRFFFSHSTSNGQTGDFKPPYTTEQRDYIRTRKLSNVLCETTNLAEVYENVFTGPSNPNGPDLVKIDCEALIRSEPFDASLFVESGYFHQ